MTLYRTRRSFVSVTALGQRTFAERIFVCPAAEAAGFLLTLSFSGELPLSTPCRGEIPGVKIAYLCEGYISYSDAEGLRESSKPVDNIGRMNNIWACAWEIATAEIIYAQSSIRGNPTGLPPIFCIEY